MVQMFVLFPVKSACGGRGSCASSQPLYSIIRQGKERSALSLDIRGERKKGAGIKW